MVKTLKNLPVQNQWTNDPETQFVALSMQILLRLSNYDPGLTLTHFMPRSNLVTLAFVWEKVKIICVFLTIAALGLKVA